MGGNASHRKALTQLQLAQLLRAFGVRPDSVRFDGVTLKGYLLEWFEKAFRYIPPTETPENNRNAGTTVEIGQNIRNKSEPDVSDKTAENSQCSGVPAISTPSEGETHIDPFEAFKDQSRRLQPKADDRPERQVDLEKAITEAKESEA